MSKWFKLLFYTLSLAVASFILLSSFQSLSKASLNPGDSLKSRRFYVQKEILPDHSLYPMIMLVDRFRLAMADQERRVYLLTAYANRRLFYALKLLERDEMCLSLTTFTKAEKYLNQALREAINLKQSDHQNPHYDELVFFVLESASKHLATLETELDRFTSEERAVLVSLEHETLFFQSQLTQ